MKIIPLNGKERDLILEIDNTYIVYLFLTFLLHRLLFKIDIEYLFLIAEPELIYMPATHYV